VTDPLWDEYVEAVRGLGGLPALLDERSRQATAEEQAAARRARSTLDADQRRCDEWSLLARRAIATAEARMVAAQVLVPDPASGPAPMAGPPDELAATVQQAERELHADLAGLDIARRRARQRAIEDARRAAERAATRRAMIRFAVLGGLVVAAILAVAIAFG